MAKLLTIRGSSGKRQGGLEVPPPQCVAASHWLPPGVSVLRRCFVSFRTTAVVFLRRRRSSSLPSVITWSICIAPYISFWRGTCPALGSPPLGPGGTTYDCATYCCSSLPGSVQKTPSTPDIGWRRPLLHTSSVTGLPNALVHLALSLSLFVSPSVLPHHHPLRSVPALRCILPR